MASPRKKIDVKENPYTPRHKPGKNDKMETSRGKPMQQQQQPVQGVQRRNYSPNQSQKQVHRSYSFYFLH